MAIVVTGAAGFIGRHVVARLLARGDEVVGIDRRRWRAQPGETSLVGDLAAADQAIDRVLATSDGVIHLAARPGVRDPARDIARLRHRDNVVAGARVLQATPDQVPVVVASSSSVYGGAGHPDRPNACHEDDPLRPRGGYSRSKVALEGHCHDRAMRGGRVSIARPFTVAGEGQRPDMALSLWIRALQRRDPVEVYGDVARRRDITDVVDVARGLVALLDLDAVTTVNLGTGVTHRLDEMIAVVAGAVGATPQVRVMPVDSCEAAATRADTTRCRDLLGFVPHTNLAAVVARQIAARVTTAVPVDRPRSAVTTGAPIMPAAVSLPA